MSTTKSLTVIGGYSTVSVGFAVNGKCIESLVMDHKKASRDLLLSIDTLFKNNHTHISDLSYIAAVRGPGPFTTLRSVLSTVNGLQYATALPLVGIDGLDAFIFQLTPLVKTSLVAVVLNAFCDDVYYALYNTKTEKLETGCETIANFVNRLAEFSMAGPVTFAGSGFTLHNAAISQALGEKCVVIDPFIDYVSLETATQFAENLFGRNIIELQLAPLYLKSSSAHLVKQIKSA